MLRSSWRPLRYALLALALTWVAWVPLLLHAHGMSVPGGQAWHFFGCLGPLASAFLVVALEHGRPGCRALARSIIKWPGRRALLVALLGPVTLLLAGLVTSRLLGGEWLDVRRLGTSSEFPGMRPWTYGPAALLFFGFGEEVGWRGYLIPVLQERLTPVHAALVFVPFWALWHAPLFFGGTNMGTMGAAAIAGWIGSLTVGSVLLSWLYNTGRGSVLPVALFHGLLDFVFLLPDPRGAFPSITGALITVWGILVLVLPGVWGIRQTPPAQRVPGSG
jgi:membrane protease YdiL (CAAX protease family)